MDGRGIIILYNNKEGLKSVMEELNENSLKELKYTTDGTLIKNDVVVLEDNDLDEKSIIAFSRVQPALIVGIDNLKMHIAFEGELQDVNTFLGYVKTL